MPSEFKGYKLDVFQAKAMEILSKSESVIVSAPTGSGKTLIIEYAIENLLLENSDTFHSQRNKIIYTSPIKALSNQKYRDFCDDYGKENIGIMTGDTVINRDAPLLIMTTEILRNILYISSEDALLSGLKLVVFDEIHYLNDPFRGVVWEESLILLPDTIPVLLLSATIPNGEELRQWLNSFRKFHAIHLLEHSHRPVPLKLFYFDGSLNKYDGKIVFSEKEKNKIIKMKKKSKRRVVNPLVYGNDIFSPADVISTLPESFFPGIYFIFSRKACEKAAKSLIHIDFNILTANEQKGVNKRIGAFIRNNKNLETLSQIETALKLIRNGIAFHHAGCVPILKEFIEVLFAEGLIKILFATETFAMGLNLPAKSVFFHALEKYDGQEVRLLSSSEFHQMAGRAGRRGIDDYGNAVAVLNLSSEEDEISDIIKGNPEPLESQFRLSYNAIANLMQTRDKSEIVVLLQSSLKEYTAKKIRDSRTSGLDNQIKILKSNLSQKLECPKELSSNEAIKSLGDLTNLLKEINILKERISIDFSEPDSRVHYSKIWDEILPVGRLILYQENPAKNFKLGILKAQIRRNKKIITESSFFQSEFVLESGKSLRLYPSEYFILPEYENLIEAQYYTKTREFVRLLNNIRNQISPHFIEEKLDDLLTGESLILSYLSDNSIKTTSLTLSQELINVEYLIEENICSGCEYFDEHRKQYLLRKKWEKNLHQLENRVIESQNLSFEAFLKMTKVLDRIGYLEDGYLGNYGYLLAYVHHENDLLISEGMKLGYFDNLTPAELCGTIALFVAGDRDKPFEKIPKIKNKKIFNIYHQFRRINEKIEIIEKEENVPEIHNQRSLGLRFVELAMQWSYGEEIEDLVQITTMLEGDIVNNLRRILNLIQQLKIVTRKLTLEHPIPFDEAIGSLKRSHVISQLEDDSEVDLMPYIPHKSSIENKFINKEDYGLNEKRYYGEEEDEEGITAPILRETRNFSYKERKPKKMYPKNRTRKDRTFKKSKRP